MSMRTPLVAPGPELPQVEDPPVKNAKRTALSRRRPPPTGNGVTPYLDVMTMSSTKFATKGKDIHCKDISHVNMFYEQQICAATITLGF